MSTFVWDRHLRFGTGHVIPTRFVPPNHDDTPQSLFPPSTNFTAIPPVNRFIRRTDNEQLLIYTDGACLDNGRANPKAGCSFVFKPSTPGPSGCGYIRFALEDKGPTSEQQPQTSNRAELRAVIAALRFRPWTGEGFTSLVIATDSEYVANGITTWVDAWLEHGWITSKGLPVKNQDIWRCLLGEIERWDDNGLRIQFWRILRERNTQADRHAKLACVEARHQDFAEIVGALV